MKKSQTKSIVRTRLKMGKLSDFWTAVIKGSLWAVSISLIAILLFAILIRFTNIPDSFIKPINQVIKVFSILIGVILGAKINPSKGLKMGFFTGVLYSILAYLIFSLLSMSFSFDMTNIIDLVFAGLIGAISGVFAVNISSKN